MSDSTDHYPQRLEELTVPVLRGDERILAYLPYTTVSKRPRGPEGKVHEGVWQSSRRYRPLVATNRRVLVFDAGRTPYPLVILAEFPVEQVTMSEVVSGRFGTERFTLTLIDEGVVPFEAGQKDDIAGLIAAINSRPT